MSLVTEPEARNAVKMLKNRIKEIRKARGLSIEELSEMTGLSASHISRMSRGDRNISLKNLEILATALKCQPEELMGGEKPVSSDLATIWAAIPTERRDLALQVLQSFVSTSVDKAKPSVDTKKKNP